MPHTAAATVARPTPAARTIASAAIASALLAACSLAPTYERPAAPVPAQYNSYSTQPSAGAGDAPSASTAPIAWQDYFTDPQLRRLIQIALDNNRDMRIAVLNLEKVRAAYQIQQAAQLPSLSASASAQRVRSQSTQGRSVDAYSVGLAVSAWELDFFGRIQSLKDQALAQYLASDESRKAYELTLAASVAQSWFTLIADEELLAISRSTLHTRDESAKLAQLRFDTGVASELDLRQVQSLQAAARATYASQQRQRAQDENALALLLGQAVPADILTTLPTQRLQSLAPLAHIPAGLPSDLLTRRPDIRAAEQSLRAANANIGAARAAFFPSISLTAQYGSASSELSGLFKGGSWVFNIGPSINLPIFDGGRNQANLEIAQASQRIAIAEYEKAIQTAFREVSDALAGHDTYAAQVRAQLDQVQAERQRLKLAELRYQNGAASYLDLLDSQRSLFSLEQADVQMRLAQLLNRVNLYKALGGGWAQPSTDIATR